MNLPFTFASDRAAEVYCTLPPGRGSQQAAAYDLRAVLDSHHLVIQPGQQALIPVGLKVALPDELLGEPLPDEVVLCAMILPRSGLAARHGVTVLNAPGLIDADYRGELGVVLVNHGQDPFMVQSGDRIAQLMFSHALLPSWRHVPSLEATERGGDGFGSTGI